MTMADFKVIVLSNSKLSFERNCIAIKHYQKQLFSLGVIVVNTEKITLYSNPM